MPADIRSKALAAIREYRVVVLTAMTTPGGDRPSVVEAFVASSRLGADGLGHRVRLDGGVWECSCGAGGCGHLLATQLVTKHAPTPTTAKGSS